MKMNVDWIYLFAIMTFFIEGSNVFNLKEFDGSLLFKCGILQFKCVENG